MRFVYLCLSATFLVPGLLCAQNSKKTSIAIIDFFLPSQAEFQKRQNEQNSKIISIDLNYGEIYTRVAKLQSYVAEVLANDERFTIVDRNTLNLVQKERELQKSEQFIDGYVVQQGAGIGAEYLLVGDFEMGDMILTIKLFSVAEQKIAGQQSVKLKKQLYSNFMSVKEPTQEAALALKENVFPLLIPVVEISEGKKEAKVLLVAGGSKHNLKEDVKLDIKVKDQREIDGEVSTYYRTVGQGSVKKVEDRNFSLLEVDKGGKEIKEMLDKGVKLYCSFVKE